MRDENNNNSENNNKRWLAIGAVGVVALGGLALALSRKEPKAIEWYGFQLRIESRGLDEASAGGKPLRWVVSVDGRLIASGTAESYEIAVAAAKSAAEATAEALASNPTPALGGVS